MVSVIFLVSLSSFFSNCLLVLPFSILSIVLSLLFFSLQIENKQNFSLSTCDSPDPLLALLFESEKSRLFQCFPNCH